MKQADTPQRDSRELFQAQFQKIVNAAFRSLNAATTDSAYDRAVDTALRDLGTLFAVDRAYLFIFSSDLALMTNTHEWCAEGIKAHKDDIKDEPTDSLPWFKQQMQQHLPLQIPDVAALPPEAASEKELFSGQGIKSLICLPTCGAEDHLFGFIGFDAVSDKQEWIDDNIVMLQLVADIIGGAYERRLTASALRAAEHQLKSKIADFDTMVKNVEGVVYRFYGRPNGEMGLYFVSDRAESILGLRSDLDSFFPNFLRCIPADEVPAFMEQVQVAVSRRAPFAYRTAFTRPDNGKQIYVALQSNATPTEAESVHVGIIQDITQEIEREQELLEKLHKIEEQAAAIKELSTPVMEIWEDVLVLPIVGVVDTRRSMEIMNRLLESIVTHQTRCVIVDITGVEIVDTKTADYLLKVVRAAKLLGTRAVLTGLSPAVAQTLVEIGADLTEVRTLRNLKEGLRDCLRFLRQGQGETQAG